MIPCYYCKEILTAIGEEAEVIDIAVEYVYINAPGAVANAFAFQNIFFGVQMEAAEIAIWQGVAQIVTHVTLLLVLCLYYKM